MDTQACGSFSRVVLLLHCTWGGVTVQRGALGGIDYGTFGRSRWARWKKPSKTFGHELWGFLVLYSMTGSKCIYFQVAFL